MNELLVVQNLHVAIGDKEILRGVNLEIKRGETHVLMGPNGSGKSTLAQVLLGDPHVSVTSGKIFFEDEDVTFLPPEERAKRGMYLGFQYPVEVPGLSMDVFLRSALAASGKPVSEEDNFQGKVTAVAAGLGVPSAILARNLNEGFSGGEKKRSEILQLKIFQPKLAMLDEFDSGLDVDGLNAASKELNSFRSPANSLLLISHYGKIVEKLKPDSIHIMYDGKIVQEGGVELVEKIEKFGFEDFLNHA